MKYEKETLERVTAPEVSLVLVFIQTNLLNFYTILPSQAFVGRFTTVINGKWDQTKLCLTSFNCSTLLSSSCALLTNNIYILSAVTGKPVRKEMKSCLPLIRNSKWEDALGGSGKVGKMHNLEILKTSENIVWKQHCTVSEYFLLLGEKKKKKPTKAASHSYCRRAQSCIKQMSDSVNSLLSYSWIYSPALSKMFILCFE